MTLKWPWTSITLIRWCKISKNYTFKFQGKKRTKIILTLQWLWACPECAKTETPTSLSSVIKKLASDLDLTFKWPCTWKYFVGGSQWSKFHTSIFCSSKDTGTSIFGPQIDPKKYLTENESLSHEDVNSENPIPLQALITKLWALEHIMTSSVELWRHNN